MSERDNYFTNQNNKEIKMSFSINPKKIKYVQTSRGVAFNAELLFNSDKVGSVENAGCGGATVVHFGNSHMRLKMEKAVEASEHEAEEWFLESLMDIAEEIG